MRSGAKRCCGITSKIAPVGHTRTHSPHHVQPALSGSPSAPTMISVCSPRWPTSSTPTTWMSSRSEEHTSELQSRLHLVCRLLLEKKKNNITNTVQKVTSGNYLMSHLTTLYGLKLGNTPF